MSFLDNFFNRKASSKQSSGIARERLQILLAQERDATKDGADSNLLRTIHTEILGVLAKHVNVEQDNVKVALDRNGDVSRLEIDIQVPESGLKAQVSTTTHVK